MLRRINMHLIIYQDDMLIMAKLVQKFIFQRDSNLPSAESRVCFESEKISPGTLSKYNNSWGMVINSIKMEISGRAGKVHCSVQTGNRGQGGFHHGQGDWHQLPKPYYQQVASKISTTWPNPGFIRFQMLSSKVTNSHGRQ